MSEIPVLVLAFNRPESVSRVFSALSQQKPANLLFSVDGPRPGNHQDISNVRAVQETVNLINWNTNLEIRFREKNLGLQLAVPDAVSWAIEKYGKVVVLEDDIIPGPDFLDFMKSALLKFDSDERIGHVSGYNLVPESSITKPTLKYRFSKFPESYAWGTWSRAWSKYDPDISRSQSHKSLKNLRLLEQLTWKNNFYLARKELISTWAYRWINSLWQNNLICVSPNRNISTYAGFTGGTHTRRKVRWSEIEQSSIHELRNDIPDEIDDLADNWISNNIFHSNIKGVFEMQLIREILRLVKVAQGWK